MTQPTRAPRSPRQRWTMAGGGVVVAVVLLGAGVLLASGPSIGPTYRSTAAPPSDYPGPKPTLLVLNENPPAHRPSDPKLAESGPANRSPLASAAAPVRLASVERGSNIARPSASKPAPALAKPLDPITEAKQMIAACKARYETVRDYTCTFFKRERLPSGQLTEQHVMSMKLRSAPKGVYLKFHKPIAGREAIWVEGENDGKVFVHDVGLGKLLAGTLSLDPRSRMAMEDCRHPITEAGIGHMINQLVEGWEAEMRHGETVVTIEKGANVGDRRCTMIESMHPKFHPSYVFHKVKVYIDQEHGLPIRFEAYDWPRRPGEPARLLEEYSYMNLKLNVGLRDHDFDPSNRSYSFGRF